MNKSTILELAEISIRYNPNFKASQRPKIRCSSDIYNLMKKVLDEGILQHHEEFWLILLDRGNKVLGVSKIAQGGIYEVTIDIRIIFQYALKTNATGLALVHNHPSNELNPSQQDKAITERIVSLGKLLDITVIDHVIITAENGYYSFVDEGLLNE